MNFSLTDIFKHADKIVPILDTISIARDEKLSLADKADKISEIWVKITPFTWDDQLREALMPYIKQFADGYKTATTKESIIALMMIAGNFLYEIGLIFKNTNGNIYKWCGFVGKSLIAVAPIADEFDIFVKGA